MAEIKMLFHVHTRKSYDSVLKIEAIIKYCKETDVSVLAVTDHDSFSEIPVYKELCDKSGITLIPGVEYSSNAGDIIGLFIKEFRPQTECNAILGDVREQGGVSIIPHPFSGHELSLLDFDLVDGLEVFNPRCSPRMNEQAMELAKRKNKIMFSGGDTHLECELGLVVSKLRCQSNLPKAESALRALIIEGEKDSSTNYTSNRNLYRSQMIKGIKQRSPKGFLRNAVKYMLPNFRVKRVS